MAPLPLSWLIDAPVKPLLTSVKSLCVKPVILLLKNTANWTLARLVGLEPTRLIASTATVTAMGPLVPVILVVAVSVAVMVCVPAVFSVTLKEPVPLVKVLLAGKLAAPSELVKWTVPP